MLHIPILRAGRPYRSLTTTTLTDFRTGAPVAEVSQANPGLIAKDLALASENKKALDALSITQLLSLCKKAAQLFGSAMLPVDDGKTQTPQEYIRQLSATTGMPEVLCKKNMAKVCLVLENMPSVITGLTRGLDMSILDQGGGVQNGIDISYVCQANSLGAILPNNSPGVHTLWLASIPLKVPLTLKPGREEPWTPFRIAQAFLAAGLPPESFGFYPADYSGATEIIMRCDRLLLFGDESTVEKWKTDRRIEIHGPGRSKLIIGSDKIRDWEKYLDVILTSVLENGGRSCINASGVWVPSNSRDIAHALAENLSRVKALPMEDPSAQLAAFVNPQVAHRISDLIDSRLKIPGAVDVTASIRKGSRVVEQDGCTFLLPTVIWCEDPQHPLANTEFLFPFVSVVEIPQDQILKEIGPTLVATAISDDQRLIHSFMNAPHVDRLNVGPVATNQVSWYHPHEGNLFELLYRQRALRVV